MNGLNKNRETQKIKIHLLKNNDFDTTHYNYHSEWE